MEIQRGHIIYTIGHSTHSLEDFVHMLQSFHINHVVDIRRFPGSKKFPQFDKENLKLALRKFKIDSGNKKFDILVDGQVLASEDIVKRWEQSKFFDVVYPIPAAWAKNKESINIAFRAKPHNSTGRIFQVRLAQKSPNK
ncbi:DUF6805 domain-containing protein [Sphingobacterium thalpophilum]|uniref:DUF6805 domain-containing protein n=1 Tax=Sphingobacterium thalpophilum TaxID=259 RepID=UPI003C7063D2